MTFDEFRAVKQKDGADEVLERVYASNQVIGVHAHPFAVDALVVNGEFWLTCEGGEPRHLRSGDAFTLQPDTPHSERYGVDGATFWVARKNRGAVVQHA